MKIFVLQTLINDSDKDGVQGCYSTLDKVKEKIINLEKKWLPTDMFRSEQFEKKITIPTKEAKTTGELNDLYEDLFFIREWEIDK